MELKTIKTICPTNPDFKDFLIIVFENHKTYLIPKREFSNLLNRAAKRFNTIVPLAPYPSIFGCEWKTNKTIYQWFTKELPKIQLRYNWILNKDCL